MNRPLNPETLKRGDLCNWSGQPERLVYLRRFDGWYQFALVRKPDVLWCEVREEDLHRLEETQS